MRTAFSLVAILLISTTLSTMAVSAEVVNDGSNITVSGTETWNESLLESDLTILEGASLLIENTTSIAQDVTITVNEGASLMVSGDLVGTELDAGLLVFDDTLLHLNFGDIADTGQVRINFDHVIPESAMFNVTIGNETQNAVGADFVDIPAPLNGTSLTVEFDIYYFFSTQITSVQALHSGASGTVVLNAEELNHTGGSLKWNAAAFEVKVFGELTINSADVSGASIVCSGTCSINDATLTGSAPVHVEDGASLIVESSFFVGSRTDEDIIVHDTANIQPMRGFACFHSDHCTPMLETLQFMPQAWGITGAPLTTSQTRPDMLESLWVNRHALSSGLMAMDNTTKKTLKLF